MADFDLICDESKDRNARKFMAFGGVMLPRERTDPLCCSIRNWRDSVGLRDEIKWRNTRAHNLARFKTYARGTMHYVNKGMLRFASAVFDLSDRKCYPDKSHIEDHNAKAYYFLLHCFALNLAHNDRLFIYPDHGFLKCAPEKLVTILNNGIAKRRRWGNVKIVRTIEEKDSENHDLVQMADLLTGAIAACNNKEHVIESRSGGAKQELIEYIAGLARHSLSSNTPPESTNFKIWFVTPAQKRSAGAPTSLVRPRVQSGPATP